MQSDQEPKSKNRQFDRKTMMVKVLQLIINQFKQDQNSPWLSDLESISSKLETKSPLDTFQKEENHIVKHLANVLLNSESRIELMRLLPPSILLQKVVSRVVQSEESLHKVLPMLGALLQFTDAFNYSCLVKTRALSNQSRQLTSKMIETRDVHLAQALVRCFVAQPYMVELINTVALFSPSQLALSTATEEFDLLMIHLRQMVQPELEVPQSSKEDRLKLVQGLMLNKREEARAQDQLFENLGESIVEMANGLDNDRQLVSQESVTLEGGQVIATSQYIMDKTQSMLREMQEKPFGHFVIRGPAGSGKMTQIRLLHHLMLLQEDEVEALEPQTMEGNKFIVVTLEETFDSKNLVGTYICSETGEFVFKKGPLTVAAEQGLWLILRNIEDTPSDLLSFLLPLVEQNTLQVTSTFAIKPKLGFRIFALTRTQEQTETVGASQVQQFFSTQEETISPLLKLLSSTHLDTLSPQENTGSSSSRTDLESIVQVKYGTGLFTPIQGIENTSVHSLLQRAIAFVDGRFKQLRSHLLDSKPTSVSQMFTLYERVSKGPLGDHLRDNLTSAADGGSSDVFLSQAQRQLIIEEVHDVYLAYMYDKAIKKTLIKELVATVFNVGESSMLDAQIIAEYITEMGREHESSNVQCIFGRASLDRKQRDGGENDDMAQTNQTQQTSKFVYTGATVRSLEQIGQSVSLDEAMLLVGETGTGKTTIVQELAKKLGKTLHVFNMNQNTDSADLLGGFKSVDLKYLLTPVYRLFLEVFSAMLNTQAPNNAKFLTLMQKTFEQNQVKEFIQCLNHGMKSIKRSKKGLDDEELEIKVAQLTQQASDLQKRAKKLASGGGFIFQFVEGTLIKSIQDGGWILLDEINLASDSVLNKLATIVQGSHILLNERADIVEMKRHADFRIFMCMNPPYSSAGKKQLPHSLRSKLTEIYVSELENEGDLWDIIDRNTKSISNPNVSCLSEDYKRQILAFYQQVRAEVMKQMQRRGNIGLRNLCRALFFIKSAIQLNYPPAKAIFDSLMTCFASHLDQQLQEAVRELIRKLFAIKKLPQLQIIEESKNQQKYVYIEGNVIARGQHKPESFDEKNFILTPSFKNLLRQLASVVSVSNFAVILEGPTSAGKTSCVQYLAQVTENRVIRINNHMHTDVQEYLGSYVPDSDTGKLVFQEGVLVEAVRNGYWVILDELNLAPSEVLEALNRLLDDNRELNIVETQTVVKAHPNFRIFATQNPTEGYGGRKELSEAFKNRFVLIRVLDVPTEELEEILVQKCSMPASRAKVMIRVMEKLQIYRSQANLFSGKNAIITVRDLLKWAGRINQNSQNGSHMDPTAIAVEGFLVLGERSRNHQDKQFILNTIQKEFKVAFDLNDLYETYFNENLSEIFDRVPAELNLPRIIPSKQLKRLAVLVAKCLRNREPVLLVGETGCGKTTLCQVFASQVTQQALMQINCHQNTETSDFIGCMRTRKNLKQTQDRLLELLEANCEESVRDAFAAARSLKKKVSIILKAEPCAEVQAEIKALSEDLNCVFEWHDGILVEAMQDGALLLIDEISLANDSVLERLNSVFEQDRVLMVTEKSSQEAIKIVAHDKFNMVATMNPSGDFGKKELSPALRNRMTEIWVESYFQQDELLQLQSKTNEVAVCHKAVSDQVDLFLIVSKLCEDARLAQSHALAIFNMINYLASFSQSESAQFQALKRKSLSIRDILCIIDFMKRNSAQMPGDECFKEAIDLVIIDGICLGIDTAGAAEQEAIVNACQTFLQKIVDTNLPDDGNTTGSLLHKQKIENTESVLKVGHYALDKKPDTGIDMQSKFAFHAETTRTNLMKLLRAYTLNKPILIEGPPGVGKTALVEQVAKVTGRKLVRVNLSEQTDMMDLLGSEYPTSSGANATGGTDGLDDAGDSEDDEDEIRFKWGDGVLLSAIKEGHWLLIDEMNLAQQSILEGLNAILDHRRTVYIPELNREFTCHPDFFVFACQNPSQSASSTSGRKTLPKSFLNRFTKIYLSELTNEDYRVIMRQVAGDTFDNPEQIDWLLALTQEIEKVIASKFDDSGAVNMRDLSRFLRVYQRAATGAGTEGDCSQLKAILHAFSTTYLMKEGVNDAKRELCLRKISQAFEESVAGQDVYDERDLLSLTQTSLVRVSQSHGLVFDGILRSQINFSTRFSNCANASNDLLMRDLINMKGTQARQLQSLSDCLQVGLPILLSTDDTTKLIRCLNLMASVKNAKLRRILLSDRSDTTQLLGCFEQTSSQDLSQVLQFLKPFKATPEYTAAIMDLELELLGNNDALDSAKQVRHLEAFIKRRAPTFDRLKPMVSRCKKGTSRFEWVDSVLIKAISVGEWAVFENANICNPSILDRLNPLLEEGNQTMVINEQGLDDTTQTLRTVLADEGFRAIFVLSRKSLVEQGRDVSRALKNRCIELSISFNGAKQSEQDEQLADLEAERLDARNLDWSLTQLQTKFDLIPCQEQLNGQSVLSDGNNNDADIRLGKRNRPAMENQIISTLRPDNIGNRAPEESGGHNRAYPHIYLEHAQSMPGSSEAKQEICQALGLQLDIDGAKISGWALYMQAQVKQLQQQLKRRLSSEITTKQLQPLFACLLSQTGEDGFDQQALHLLLSNLLQVRGLSASLDHPLNIYLTSLVLSQSEELRAVKGTLQSSAGMMMSGELNFLLTDDFSCDDQMQALSLLKPNALTDASLSAYLDKGLQVAQVLTDQRIFMYKANAAKLAKLVESRADVAHSGRVALTICMLSGELDDDDDEGVAVGNTMVGLSGQRRRATVIMLNAEREILSDEEMTKCLVDLDDPSQVLESPNLVVIPHDQGSKNVQGVVTSQSYLYESLCDLKDWLRIQAGKNRPPSHFRQTRIPISSDLLLQDEKTAALSNQISLLARPIITAENGSYTFEDRLMEAVLVDQHTICVRDLPAFYACAFSLLYKLDEINRKSGEQEARFEQKFRALCQKKIDDDEEEMNGVRDDKKQLLGKLQDRIPEADSDNADCANMVTLAKESSEGIVESLTLIGSLKTEQVIHGLLVLPLEIKRQDNALSFAQQALQSYLDFHAHHLGVSRDSRQHLPPLEQEEARVRQITERLSKLEQLQASSGSRLSERQQGQLRPLLAFINNLLGEVKRIEHGLKTIDESVNYLCKDTRERCETVIGLLDSSTRTLLPMFNHICSELFAGCLSLVSHTRRYCLALESVQLKISPSKSLCQTLINLDNSLERNQKTSMIFGMLRESKNSKDKQLVEKCLLWATKLCRLTVNHRNLAGDRVDDQSEKIEEQRSLSHIFEYFVRREVAKKLAAEREENATGEQVFHVPFRVKQQDLPDFVGKAMDEWTKEDVARMEAEAEKEIETNFPSYFDEVQQQFFSGELAKKDYSSRDAAVSIGRARKVTIEMIFAELLGVTKSDSQAYFLEYLKDRLDMVRVCLKVDAFEELKRSYGMDTLLRAELSDLGVSVPQWQEDTALVLKKMLQGSQSAKTSKELMNISEVNLTSSYNFYHDSFPEEARSVYEPMQNLLIRLRDIVIRDEYESPLLNESIFLANYIISCFSSEATPLMKLLTSMEFLLTKLEEWENTYASKRLNSVETEINTLKMLIIRYRKIQILSWRNLLNWRKDNMIKEDVMECCRLAHTVERQVFDLKLYKSASAKKEGQRRRVVVKHKSDTKGRKLKTDHSAVQERSVIVKDTGADQCVEAKVFELLDLFIRDSSLGVYQSRLIFIDFLRKHLWYKLENQCSKQPDALKERLTKVINVVRFVHAYYAQFETKLKKTVERLDAAARTKVKTLIDVGKWTVQKFTIVKNNIDKTHRQLNRACKEEEEALLQNVQTLVIASSRKKYANTEDQLLSLHQIKSGSKDVASAKPEFTSVPMSTLAKLIQFMIANTVTPLLPRADSLNDTTNAFLERLSEVRALNKKHIQVRAYYDLLRFMKSQGLTYSSFNSSGQIQQLLIDNALFDYDVSNGIEVQFFRAYETYSMVQAASQVDERSHIKNEEVLRMQAFSRSLMAAILQLSKQLVDSRTVIDTFKTLVTIQKPDNSSKIAISDTSEILSEQRLIELKQALDATLHLIRGTRQRLHLLSFQEASLYATCQTLDCIAKSLDSVDLLGSKNPQSQILDLLKTLENELQGKKTPELHQTSRISLVCEQALTRASEIRFMLELHSDPVGADVEMQPAEQDGFDKTVKQVENLAKLCMQRVVMSYRALSEEKGDEQSQRKASLTADMSNNAGGGATEQADADADSVGTIQKETSIEEMLEFAKNLHQVVLSDPKTTKLIAKSKQVFALRGVSEASERNSTITRQKVESTREVIGQLNACLQESQSRIESFLRSMVRFGYLSQRVFIHLIYQGFCGQEAEDDPDVEPPSDLEADGERDGCGLGDGKGGKDNITDQIEHEEQLEGLKNYESEQEQDEEKEEQNDKEQQDDQEEEDNDFEMKNDFDGEMDSEPEEQKPEDKKEDDDDDEMDKVDDMLDNQLWDQNMEDMEQKEKEEAEKNDEEKKEEDKEEVDLGERDLHDQNLLPQHPDDKDMAEGDRDQQEQQEAKPEDDNQGQEEEQPDQQDEEDKDADGDDEGERDDQDEGEEDGDEIPLDKNSVLAEEEEKFSEDAKSNDEDGQKSEQDENADKEDVDEDEVDSQFDEEQGKDQEEDQDMQSDDQDAPDQVQQKPDQAVLEDDQLEGKQDQKQDDEAKEEKMDQANLKKRKDEAMQDQKQNEQNQQQQDQEEEKNQISQADASGTDLLFEMAKQFQQRQENKKQQKQQQQQQEQKQDKEDASKQQVEDPQMAENEEQMENQNQDDAKEDCDMQNTEFVHDQNQAEKIQGKLATDHVEEEDEDDKNQEKHQDGKEQQNPEEEEDLPMLEQEEPRENDQEEEELPEEDLERTKAQFKETGKLQQSQKQEQKRGEDSEEEDKEMQGDNEQKEESRDLIDEYDAYLKERHQREEKKEAEGGDTEMADQKPDDSCVPSSFFTQNLDMFDYIAQKMQIRELFHGWLSDEREHEQSLALLAKFKNQTQSASNQLCEQLRIVLEPQLSQNLQGDFKTGKRLNMKKVISFIASHYRNDKIWLRRTLPSKRDYKILIAIDDSMSMRENNQGFFSLEAMIALTEALNRLEVGKVAVARIRDRMDLIHSFDDTYTSEKAGFIVSQFSFEHQAPTSADSAMANFVSDSNKLLDMQNGGGSSAINCPFVIVLSDGRFNKENARRYIREASEKRYLYIFVILDKTQDSATGQGAGGVKPAKSATANKQSILSMRHAIKQPSTGRVKLVPYLKDFPFEYYCIVGDIKELPNALGSILVQWFSMVSATAAGK